MHRSSLAETLRLSDLPACVPPRRFSSSLGTLAAIDCLLWALHTDRIGSDVAAGKCRRNCWLARRGQRGCGRSLSHGAGAGPRRGLRQRARRVASSRLGP